MVDIYNEVVQGGRGGFADTSCEALDNLGLDARIRVTQDRERFDLVRQRMTIAAYIVDAELMPREHPWTSVDPRVGVESRALSNMFAYAARSSGYDAGGFNGRPLTNETTVTRDDSEKLWRDEPGLESAWLQHKPFVNAAGFYYDYRDMRLTRRF